MYNSIYKCQVQMSDDISAAIRFLEKRLNITFSERVRKAIHNLIESELITDDDDMEEKLAKLKVVDLRAMCKEMGIDRYSKLKKNELIRAIIDNSEKSPKAKLPVQKAKSPKAKSSTNRSIVSSKSLASFQALKRNSENGFSSAHRKIVNKLGVTSKVVQIPGGEYAYTHFNMDGYDALSNVDQLFLAGVTVIPIIDKKQIKEYQRKFDDALQNFREYARDPDNPTLDSQGNPLVYVAGGFAALGNPSSFHNEFSREMRMVGFEGMMEIVKDYSKMIASDVEYNLQALSDRMMFRQKGQKPTPESWHRDVMKPGSIDEYDEIFGGWINLDTKDQYFSCIPGSHLDIVQKRLTAGFATLSGTMDKINGKKTPPAELKAAIQKVTKDKHLFTVPPGYMIVFPQYILHEVIANVAEYNMRRQFTGWRLTTSDSSLYPLSLFDDNAVIPLPGSMIPPMYAQMHLMHHKTKPFKIGPNTTYSLTEWSEATFHEECIGDNGLVHRHMKSLKEYDFPLYPAYTKKEKKILTGIRV